MKRGGRTLDHQSLETIRLMAVERVREGESPAAVIASYGFHRTVIYRWLKAAREAGSEVAALCAKPVTGRTRRLTPSQEAQVFPWIDGTDPRQHGFDAGLWTRALVANLVAQKFGIRLGLTAIGALLARLGITPQKPLQRAYQRNPEAIERWQRETWPGIARQAAVDGAEVCFWDESGFGADAVHGRPGG